MPGSAHESDAADVAGRISENASDLADRTVVLSGANGFLGRKFLDVFAYMNQSILDRPCRVIAIDNMALSHPSMSTDYLIPVQQDITKAFELEGDFQFVIHAAGIASPQQYRSRPLETIDVATAGTRNLLDLARSRRARLLFFSSSEIYGDPDPDHVPTSESYRGNVSPQGPRACYDESKRLGETLCYVFNAMYGVHTTIVRPFNVFGPGMPENDFRVLPNFASRLKRDLPLRIYGSGMQTRTYCYVTDALVGFLLALMRGAAGATYNVGNPVPEVSVHELIAVMERVLGRNIAVEQVDHPPEYPADEPNRRCPDIGKAQRELGYNPVVPLEAGLRRFLDWAEIAYGSLNAS